MPLSFFQLPGMSITVAGIVAGIIASASNKGDSKEEDTMSYGYYNAGYSRMARTAANRLLSNSTAVPCEARGLLFLARVSDRERRF